MTLTPNGTAARDGIALQPLIPLGGSEGEVCLFYRCHSLLQVFGQIIEEPCNA